MSIFRTALTLGFLCSAAVYGDGVTTVDLSSPVVLEDFDDIYGDTPNQSTIGAAYGILTQQGKYYKGGGYWYFFVDEKGSSVKDSTGSTPLGDYSSMMPSKSLYVKMVTSTSSADPSFAGVGFSLADTGEIGLNLSKATAITLRVKGTGTVRVQFETKDIGDLHIGWGWYGKDITLTSDWKTETISVSDLAPEPYSPPAKETPAWTWAHGSNDVHKLVFQVKGGQDVELHVDDIKLVGMTYGDLGLAAPVIKMPKANKSNIFSVNGSSISFNLKKAQNVNVSLHDIQGNKIQSLYAGNAAAATINLNNLKISGGRYFVKVTGKDLNYTQPIMFMK